jgi:hypothetical protein
MGQDEQDEDGKGWDRMGKDGTGLKGWDRMRQDATG